MDREGKPPVRTGGECLCGGRPSAACTACGAAQPAYWCDGCDRAVPEKRCPLCGLKARKMR